MLRRIAAVLIAVGLLIGAGYIGHDVYQDYLESKVPKTTVSGGISGLKSYAQELESNPPSASLPLEERLAHSDRLFDVHVDARQYQQAVRVFEAREKLSQDGLSYNDYFSVAEAYAGVNNTAKAIVNIDRAVTMAPQNDDIDNGYVRQDIIDYANRKRQELE